MTFYLHLALGATTTPEWMSNLSSGDYKTISITKILVTIEKCAWRGVGDGSPSVVKEATVIPR